MKIFEILMLIAFGFAWPFSIYKSYISKSTKGKSVIFLFIVLLGYISGICHKILNNFDFVVIFYIINANLVFTDIIIFYRNKKLEKKL